MGYCAPEAQANSHLNTARSWRDDEIRFWVPSRHCSISADITGHQQETDGPEGTVASKTIRSVNMINQGLARLQSNIAKINPELTVKPEASLTVKIENLLAVSHFKHQICKQLHYARDFETTALESAKRIRKKEEETTKYKAGTLPLNMYQTAVPRGERKRRGRRRRTYIEGPRRRSALRIR